MVALAANEMMQKLDAEFFKGANKPRLQSAEPSLC